jgi:hypothetical protein
MGIGADVLMCAGSPRTWSGMTSLRIVIPLYLFV